MNTPDILVVGERFTVRFDDALNAVNKINRAFQLSEINNIMTMVNGSTIELASPMKGKQERQIVEKFVKKFAPKVFTPKITRIPKGEVNAS